MILPGGTNICGIPIGVLCLETYYGKVPGHIRNATTFHFPVTYKVVKGATPRNVVEKADPSLVGSFVQAARELEQEGVRAITSSCGFLVLFQRELADSVHIPVFVSSLIQIPMVHRMLRKDQKVGILTASKNSLTEEHLRAVGADAVPVCVAGMEEQGEFREVILEGKRNELNMDRLAKEVLSVVDTLGEENPEMGALVIECTDLVSFAHWIQKRVRIPIFDVVTLTNMAYEAVVRRDYRGIVPF
jgi:Asp/Glu/hydantoin racemase